MVFQIFSSILIGKLDSCVCILHLKNVENWKKKNENKNAENKNKYKNNPIIDINLIIKAHDKLLLYSLYIIYRKIFFYRNKSEVQL